MTLLECDCCVVGSGIAGLMLALKVAAARRVLVLTKKTRADSNTNYAQGGIACAIEPDDSLEQHVQDTLAAGAGLCNEAVVRRLVAAGPERIRELERMGLAFARSSRTHSGYDLGQEGGHSRRRVLHAGDITGRAIETLLLAQIQATPPIVLLEHTMLVDLITTTSLGLDDTKRCVGLYALDRTTGKVLAVRTPCVVLATGGGGKVYLYTSNPDIATGDGFAVAWRAGARIRNMEFIQFHPTCLYHPEAKSFLISEAVRGEGAYLVDADGHRFMSKYDPRAELAPRDIVARAIDQEMKAIGSPCVYLDIRHRSRVFLQERFPTIYETCRHYGYDMATDRIPVVPAAHYFCGGVEAGVDGQTSLPGLFACGEVACTGLHGANRLASNSLLEALVTAHETAAHILSLPPADAWPPVRIPNWEIGRAVSSDEAIVVEHNWNEVRTCMWDYVGIVRTNKRLSRARRRIENLRTEIQEYYLDHALTADVLELRNIADVAELIVRCAESRRESRGLHYTLDYPQMLPEARDTVIEGIPDRSA